MLKIKNLKKGDNVYCYKPCIMNISGTKSTTAGKSYEIIKITDKKFYIIDDQCDHHSFNFELLDEKKRNMGKLVSLQPKNT